jgi:hypothetical protein
MQEVAERLVQTLFRWRGAGSTSSPSAFDVFRRCGSGRTPYRLDGQRSHRSPRFASVYRCGRFRGESHAERLIKAGGGGRPGPDRLDHRPTRTTSARAVGMPPWRPQGSTLAQLLRTACLCGSRPPKRLRKPLRVRAPARRITGSSWLPGPARLEGHLRLAMSMSR